MFNKLKSVKPSNNVNGNDSVDKPCSRCGNSGEVPMLNIVEEDGVRVKNKYYLCGPCLLKILTPCCSECEDRDEPYKLIIDVDCLEVVCGNCGLVLGDLRFMDHIEKRDYTINEPRDYNSLDAVECVTYNLVE